MRNEKYGVRMYGLLKSINLNALLISLVLHLHIYQFPYLLPWPHYNLELSPFDLCYAFVLSSGDQMIGKPMEEHVYGMNVSETLNPNT